MKHFSCASWCRPFAFSIMSGELTVTCGRSTTSVKRPPPSASSVMVATASSRYPVTTTPPGRAQVQVPQHVALGQRRGEQLLGIPAIRIAPERRIGAPRDRLGAAACGNHAPGPVRRSPRGCDRRLGTRSCPRPGSRSRAPKHGADALLVLTPIWGYDPG